MQKISVKSRFFNSRVKVETQPQMELDSASGNKRSNENVQDEESGTKRLKSQNSESKGEKRLYTPSSFQLSGKHCSSYQKFLVFAEEDCGISKYISTLEGFSGILKQRYPLNYNLIFNNDLLSFTIQRYSDFLVYEVDTDGNIVHLTAPTIPEENFDAPQLAQEESGIQF